MRYSVQMIVCRTNVREGGDGRFYISVSGDEGVNPFYHSNDEYQIRTEYVQNWCNENCAHGFEIYGPSTLCFDDPADAALFWFTHSEKKETKE